MGCGGGGGGLLRCYSYIHAVVMKQKCLCRPPVCACALRVWMLDTRLSPAPLCCLQGRKSVAIWYETIWNVQERDITRKGTAIQTRERRQRIRMRGQTSLRNSTWNTLKSMCTLCHMPKNTPIQSSVHQASMIAACTMPRGSRKAH